MRIGLSLRDRSGDVFGNLSRSDPTVLGVGLEAFDFTGKLGNEVFVLRFE